jgi:beta-glucosidase
VAPKERAADLLAAMSFEETIALTVHDFDAVAHLGIPPLRYIDGPNGIRGPEKRDCVPGYK